MYNKFIDSYNLHYIFHYTQEIVFVKDPVFDKRAEQWKSEICDKNHKGRRPRTNVKEVKKLLKKENIQSEWFLKNITK